jgi:hypothetical protein
MTTAKRFRCRPTSCPRSTSTASDRCRTRGHNTAARPPDSERLRTDTGKRQARGEGRREGNGLMGPGGRQHVAHEQLISSEMVAEVQLTGLSLNAKSTGNPVLFTTPGWTRTSDPGIRNPMLYPTELRAQRGFLRLRTATVRRSVRRRPRKPHSVPRRVGWQRGPPDRTPPSRHPRSAPRWSPRSSGGWFRSIRGALVPSVGQA